MACEFWVFLRENALTLFEFCVDVALDLKKRGWEGICTMVKFCELLCDLRIIVPEYYTGIELCCIDVVGIRNNSIWASYGLWMMLYRIVFGFDKYILCAV